MARIPPSLAGKRLAIWMKDGKAYKIEHIPKCKDHAEFEELTRGCAEIIPAGTAVRKGYLSANELKQMVSHIVTGAAVAGPAKLEQHNATTIIKEFKSRWGYKNERYSKWVPLVEKGKVKEHIKAYDYVEERVAVFICQRQGNLTLPIRCTEMRCTTTKVRH